MESLPSLSVLQSWADMARHQVLLVVLPDLPAVAWAYQGLQSLLNDSEVPILMFPDWEILPFDRFSPAKKLISERLVCLYKLPQLQRGVVLVAITTMTQRLCPQVYIIQRSLLLQAGGALDLLQQKQHLLLAGYQQVPLVRQHGEFALRGSLLDLFPMGSRCPVRIDTFGPTITGLKYFDTVTQRSFGKPLGEVAILPGHEFSLDEAALALFSENWQTKIGPVTNNQAYQMVKQGKMFAGIESYFPLFFTNTDTFVTYLPSNTTVLLLHQSLHSAEKFWHTIEQCYEQQRYDLERPLPAIAEYFLTPAALLATLQEKLGVASVQTCSDEIVVFEPTKEGLVPQVELAVPGEEDKAAPANSSLPCVSPDSFMPGDFVVHAEYGIGKYAGMTELVTDGTSNAFLMLEYAHDDKLYIPVLQLHVLKLHAPATALVEVDSLRNNRWQKEKEKAFLQARDAAAGLLAIYAKRAESRSFICPAPAEEYQQFIARFPFQTTLEQERAIQAVLADLQQEKPMDRLICGDVGFGKTEVAMRAAFMVLQAGKQVAVLVPTTLLAEQHYQNFLERFEGFGFCLHVLSRFVPRSKQQQIMAEVANGACNLVIGTHKLLYGALQFKDLGLVIIDEEHRFGVRQKEYFKALRSEVNVLTMTATPIPRTLNMALSKVRDLSLITTPPAERLPIKTIVAAKESGLIRQALARELNRGGQVYYVYNNITNINNIAQEVAGLFPEARIKVAHGQMAERLLETIMVEFYHHMFDILICTTIIETGIDVPNANTIIIERAELLGLSQLHQLRGRVGRSAHQAYAFCLFSPERDLNDTAWQRLEALRQFVALGSGFALASSDMEIRGVGELLGESQSGVVQKIGLHMYLELLEFAVAHPQALSYDVYLHTRPGILEIDLGLPCLLPDVYVPELELRLNLYHRLAELQHVYAVTEMEYELRDRFGILPLQAQYLLAVTRLRIVGQSYGVKKIQAHTRGGSVFFQEQSRVDLPKLLHLVNKEPKTYRLVQPNGIKFVVEFVEAAQRWQFIEQLLSMICVVEQAPC
jgi:transcription-repair coupling factor